MILLSLPPSAVAVDYSSYQKHFLAYVAKDGRVNYAALHADKNRKKWIQKIATIKEPIGVEERKAFYINVYNSLTLDVVADHFPIESIKDIDNGELWKKRHFTVAGKRISLDQIENNILRTMQDNRIHAAINCAAKGCPSLSSSPYSPSLLSAQLDKACTRWIRSNAYQWKQNKLLISNIFIWYIKDFPKSSNPHLFKRMGDKSGIIAFLLRYAEEPEKTKLMNAQSPIRIQPYDWRIND